MLWHRSGIACLYWRSHIYLNRKKPSKKSKVGRLNKYLSIKQIEKVFINRQFLSPGKYGKVEIEVKNEAIFGYSRKLKKRRGHPMVGARGFQL
jgi:hypothetical protein